MAETPGIEGDEAVDAPEPEPSVPGPDSRIVVELPALEPVGEVVQRLDGHRLGVEVDQPVVGAHPEVAAVVLQYLVNDVARQSLAGGDARKGLVDLVVKAEPAVLGGEPKPPFAVLEGAGDAVVAERGGVVRVVMEVPDCIAPGIVTNDPLIEGREPDVAVAVLEDVADERGADAVEDAESVDLGHIDRDAARGADPRCVAAVGIDGEDIVVHERVRPVAFFVVTPLPGFQVQHVDALAECPDPQFVAGEIQALDVAVRDVQRGAVGRDMCEAVLGDVVVVEPVVLGGDPQVAPLVGHESPNAAAVDRVLVGDGIERLEERVLPGDVVHTPEVASDPYAALAVPENGIDGVVGKRLVVELFVREVLLHPIVLQDVDAALGPDPVFRFRDRLDDPDIDVRRFVEGEFF